MCTPWWTRVAKMTMIGLRDYPKQLFCDALMQLCEEMPLGKITVTKVVQRAGTARQTFYNHFKDLNDLVSYLPINYLSSRSTKPHDEDAVKRAYLFAVEHKPFFCQLPYHAGQNNFRETFIAWIEEGHYQRYISNEMPPEERMRRMLAIDLYASGVTDLFLEWCKANLSWPLDIVLQVTMEAAPAFVTGGAS